MGRPRKNPEVAATPKLNVSEVVAKVGLTPEMQQQLLALAKGVAVASADAALVYASDNLAKVNFGSWNPMVISIGGLLLSQIRNVLHGGQVSASAQDILKALDVQEECPCPPVEPEKKEEEAKPPQEEKKEE